MCVCFGSAFVCETLSEMWVQIGKDQDCSEIHGFLGHCNRLELRLVPTESSLHKQIVLLLKTQNVYQPANNHLVSWPWVKSPYPQ